MAPATPGEGAATAPGDDAPARLTVGLVRGLRGLRGHVRIELLTDRPEERFVAGGLVYPEGSSTPLTIDETSAVADGPGWWLRFREVPDRNAADALRGVYLEIEPPAETREAGRWFWHELEGLEVRGSDGTELGRVVELYRAGGAEVFVVRGPRGELDVPGVKGIVLELAPERGEMIVDMEALALDARPVDDDEYVRPRDRRPANPKRPKAPRQPASEAPAVHPKARPPKAGKAGVATSGAAGARTRPGPKEDLGTRVLTPDEIAILRAAAPADPPEGDREPPSDAG